MTTERLGEFGKTAGVLASKPVETLKERAFE